jgi:nucleotide-binding universal stress UspA family protein
MFKQILIPTDGSNVARKAIDAGVNLAKELGASVVGYYAAEHIDRVTYAEGSGVPPVSTKDLRSTEMERGQHYLREIVQACEAAGVACDTVITSPATPHQGIVDAARAKQCDAVFMASHGRGELTSLLLGSVTAKVLSHSKIPVLVYR